MYVAFNGRDKPDSVDLRLATRPTHLEFLNSLGGTLRLGGPLMDEATGKPIGSLVVLEVETVDEAREIMARDPYAIAGLFASMEFHPWTWIFGNPDKTD